jgi:glycosyltransferase involved in cell wall biosynthesis
MADEGIVGVSEFPQIPLVSILTPVFNGSDFVGAAIESVQNQGGGVEHVVMDGGSSDGTAELLRSVSRDGLIWRSEPDKGQSDALNKALALSSGDIVGWLNADETYLPGTIGTVVDFFQRYPLVDVVYGDYYRVEANGSLQRLVAGHRFSRKVLRLYGCYIPSCATFVRRRALPEAPWSTELRWVMDWELFLRLERDGCRFSYIPQPLSTFIVHPDQVTAGDRTPYEHEWRMIRERYGISLSNHRWPDRLVGLALHGLLKVSDGSFGRERSQ